METKRSSPSNTEKLHILAVFIAQSSILGFESRQPKIKEKRRFVRAFTLMPTPAWEPGDPLTPYHLVLKSLCLAVPKATLASTKLRVVLHDGDTKQPSKYDSIPHYEI